MRSMTGFGTAEGKVGKGRLFVEVKSVNHRFTEFNIKIPNHMGVIESLLRGHLQNHFQRGKVDVYFKEKEPLFGESSFAVDFALAEKYRRALHSLYKKMRMPEKYDFLSVVGIDRLVRLEEPRGAYERLWTQIVKLVDAAALHVKKMQLKEGEHTRRDQDKHLAKVTGLIKRIRMQSERALNQSVERARRKVSGGQDIKNFDEQRFQMEVSLIGGRQDIAEELTRLESHIKQYSDLINLQEPVGRKLDFLLQEMNREANTIGAKASDALISQLVVDCKAELERLKEQVQNVE